MFSFIKSKAERLLDKLSKQGFKAEEVDHKNKAAIIKLGNHEALLSFDTSIIRLEAALVFDAKIINLQTFSNIIMYSSFYDCITSHLMIQDNKKIKVIFKIFVDVKTAGRDARKMQKCLSSCTTYISERLAQQQLDNLDLSMFEEIDLSSFDPRTLGEKKQFIYKSWQNFIVDAAQETSSNKDLSDLVMELTACSEFEQRNKMLLSEVGDSVLNELIWNKSIPDNEDFHIN